MYISLICAHCRYAYSVYHGLWQQDCGGVWICYGTAVQLVVSPCQILLMATQFREAFAPNTCGHSSQCISSLRVSTIERGWLHLCLQWGDNVIVFLECGLWALLSWRFTLFSYSSYSLRNSHVLITWSISLHHAFTFLIIPMFHLIYAYHIPILSHYYLRSSLLLSIFHLIHTASYLFDYLCTFYILSYCSIFLLSSYWTFYSTYLLALFLIVIPTKFQVFLTFLLVDSST